jgi:HD-GYP domain-containing protein (c-di-GMP phosphodiesterase class II)
MSHDEALLELQRSAGSQFDPAIVGLFVDQLATGLAHTGALAS